MQPLQNGLGLYQLHEENSIFFLEKSRGKRKCKNVSQVLVHFESLITAGVNVIYFQKHLEG